MNNFFDCIVQINIIHYYWWRCVTETSSSARHRRRLQTPEEDQIGALRKIQVATRSCGARVAFTCTIVLQYNEKKLVPQLTSKSNARTRQWPPIFNIFSSSILVWVILSSSYF